MLIDLTLLTPMLQLIYRPSMEVVVTFQTVNQSLANQRLWQCTPGQDHHWVYIPDLRFGPSASLEIQIRCRCLHLVLAERQNVNGGEGGVVCRSV